QNRQMRREFLVGDLREVPVDAGLKLVEQVARQAPVEMVHHAIALDAEGFFDVAQTPAPKIATMRPPSSESRRRSISLTTRAGSDRSAGRYRYWRPRRRHS